MRNKIFINLGLLLVFTLALSNAAMAETPSPTPPPTPTPGVVNVDNSAVQDLLAMPTNVKWQAKPIAAATQAENYAASLIQAQVNKLKAKGAVTIERTFVTTRPPVERDWHKYVPSFRQWYLTGLNSKGKKVGKSSLLPEDLPNLASRLVTFGPNGCSLTKKAKYPCEIIKASPQDYLNAALRTAVEMNGWLTYSVEVQSYYVGLIEQCMSGDTPYTVTKTKIVCTLAEPADDGSTSVSYPLNFYSSEYDFGYKLRVDTATNTAYMTITRPKHTDISNRGTYVAKTTVINFGR